MSEGMPDIGLELRRPEGRHLEAVPDPGTEHPQNEGVSLSLPTYDTQVDPSYRKDLGTTRHHRIGTTWLEEWRMDDGTRYHVMIGEPEKNGIDIVVAKDTALGTQVEGFNEDVGRLLMKLGFPFVIKGPEIGTSIPLSHSAHNTHQVLDRAEEIGFFRSKVAAIEGYSRGAMIGFGTIALAEENKRRIIYSNLTDPCVEHEIAIDCEQLDDLVEHGPTEVATFMMQMGNLALHPIKAWHYRKTVDLSIAGALQFYRTAKPVFSGEAGPLSRQMPLDTQATVGFFQNSIANNEAEYIPILSRYPNIVIKHPRGGHLGGVDEQILDNISKPFSGLSIQLRSGVELDDIDYGMVHQLKEPFAA